METKFFSALLLLSLSVIAGAVPSVTTKPYHKFEAASTTSPSSTATATLLPAVHWNRNLRDHHSLVPGNNSLLYYAEQSGVQDPYVKHLYVAVNATFTAPTVVLEHSAYISHLKCEDNGLVVTLNNNQAFEAIKNSWNIKGLQLLTYSAGCARAHNNSRTYWQATGVTFSSTSDGGVAHVACSIVPQAQGLASAELVWGTHKPSSSGSSNVALRNRDNAGTPKAKHPRKPRCNPPKQGLQGLDAVNWCDPDFDKRLDEEIGLKSITEQSFLPALEQAAKAIGLGGIGRRGIFSSSSSSSSCGILSSIIGSCSDSSSSSSSSCGILSSIVGSCSSSDSESLSSGEIPIELTLPQEDDSPWGPAYKIYSYPDDGGDDGGDGGDGGGGSSSNSGGSSSCGFLSSLIGDCGGSSSSSSSIFGGIFSRNTKRADGGGEGDGEGDGDGGLSGSIALYCVDCGITGDVDITGTAKFNILHLSVSEVGVSMTGQMNAGIKLGLDAKIEYTDTWTKQVLNIPVSPFEVPLLISIGPVLTLDVSLEFDASAEGQLLASAGMQIGPFSAGFDFIGSNNYQSGFEPTFSYDFDASGEIKVSSKLTMPVGIGVGVDIIPLDWSKTISIFDAPGLEATADYKKHFHTGSDGSSSSSSTSTSSGGTCQGVYWHINVVNDIYLNIFDIGDPVSLYTYTSPAIAHGCIAIGGDSSSSSSSNGGGSSSSNNGGGSSSSNNGGGSSSSNNGGGSSSSNNGGGSSSSNNGGGSSSSNNGGGSSSSNNGGGSSSTPPQSNNIHLAHARGSRSTMYAAPDGNFYVDGTSPATDFMTSDGTVISDTAGRYFHFYKDEMTAFGVSRMRLSTLDEVPDTAEMFVFQPREPHSKANGQERLPRYVAVDSLSNMYYPVLCSIKDQSPKLFLEQAKHSHPALKTKLLTWTVTGGEVERCRDFYISESKHAPRHHHQPPDKTESVKDSNSFWQ